MRSVGRLPARLAKAARGALRLLAQPARAGTRRQGIVLQPYRGYGSAEEVFLIGRVFSQPGGDAAPADGSAGRDAVDLGRWLLRRGIGGAVVEASFGGTKVQVTSDRDGYFRIHLRPASLPPGDGPWHRIELELRAPVQLRASGELFIPPATSRCVVISDIDDTVMQTGVASKAVMLWRLLMEGADSRLAFPGMAALLRALHAGPSGAGPSGAEGNPMLYVSRAPWHNYEVLEAFFKLHDIPVGPLLFLREWGLTLQRPLPRRGRSHKILLIRNMLALYHDRPFVLIGDSGQRDPEIYAQVVHEHPGRVVAVYLRNVSRDPARIRAIEALAVEVAAAGSSLLLAADSLAMAEHAAGLGLIARDKVALVGDERRAGPGEPAPAPTRSVVRPTPQGTARAVEHGRLGEALADGGRHGQVPNVVVEPGNPGPG